MEILLYVLSGLFMYVLGIFGLVYLHGRLTGAQNWDWEPWEVLGIIFWPIVLVVAIPGGPVVYLIIKSIQISDKLHERGREQYEGAATRQRQAREIQTMEMFEDNNDDGVHPTTFGS